MHEKIQAILRDVLHAPDLNVTRETSASNVNGWDSLAHVDILWNVEQEFGIRVPLGEVQGLKNVGDLIDLVNRKIASKG